MNIDLDKLTIEELVQLRDRTIDMLGRKVAERQAELESELKKLAQYGTPTAKKPAALKKKKAEDAQTISQAA